MSAAVSTEMAAAAAEPGAVAQDTISADSPVAAESAAFSQDPADGASEAQPLRLEGCTKLDLQRFLAVLFPR